MHVAIVRVLAVLLVLPSLAREVRAASPSTNAVPVAAPPFSFIAIGCMPYARQADSDAAYGRVLAEINRHAPVFAVHLGDIMGGEEACTDDLLRRRLREFDSVDCPLIFTPGDNEWTDVHRTGKLDPLERLARIRELFFADENSRGRRPLALVTQRRVPALAKFVENARWTHGGVVFASVHVVGSSNNDQPSIPGAVEEWRERDQANAAWIRGTFAEAQAGGAPGVVLFCQANPFTGHAGFALFLETLADGARAFGKPVLLVHADEHRYRLETGVRTKAGTAPVPNITRLETFGAADFHGVFVTVDPGSAGVFLPGPLIVPGNPLPRLPRPAPAAAPAVTGKP